MFLSTTSLDRRVKNDRQTTFSTDEISPRAKKSWSLAFASWNLSFLFSYGVSSRRIWSPFLCTIFFCESKTWRDIWYKWAQISQTNKQSISYNLIQLNDLIQLIDESEMLTKWIIYSRIIRIRVEYILFIISFIRLTYLTFVSFSLSISFSKQPNSASKLYPTLHLTRYSCSFRYFDIMNFVKLVETEWNQ